ncbi:MAG: MazG family protein [Cognaticolwellia sp.]|jgi:MazG family protein
MTGMQHLRSVVARLRKDCPWDAAQTADSMRPYLLEECHETLEAIAEGSTSHVREELGDLLFQILLISEIYGEQRLFDLDDVAQGIADKMVRRHPHVYAQCPPAHDAKSTIAQWENDKSRERGQEGSVLDGVPKSLPALLRAHRVGEKVAHMGFDWPNIDAVRSKVDEELAELDEALQGQDRSAIAHEYGDVLLALSSLGRFLELAPEQSLQDANRRFEGRFRVLEGLARSQSIAIEEADDSTLDALWEAAKVIHTKGSSEGKGE